MKKYYYLVAMPECLIVSHLAPFDFGNYLSVGIEEKTRGQAIFFEVDPDKTTLHQDYVDLKMKPYENGQPKRSVYLSIYRVFEKIFRDWGLDYTFVDPKVLAQIEVDLSVVES